MEGGKERLRKRGRGGSREDGREGKRERKGREGGSKEREGCGEGEGERGRGVERERRWGESGRGVEREKQRWKGRERDTQRVSVDECFDVPFIVVNGISLRISGEE